jgi:peroxiredoxin (alkyl hydroperoxide reductase subunit C)
MVTAGDRKMGIPRIGDTAPLFDAETTMGPVKLDDYRGSWLVFFSHPADFTPVCTTEFIALANMLPEFKSRGVELLGLSVDSLPSHIAWIRNIEEKMGTKINFPVASDSDRFISTLYGMIHPEQSKTATVRCVFIIDPKQVIRAIIYYPSTIGRSTEEILRLIDALQTSDKYNVATPADWKPGDAVILPEPLTLKGVEERLDENHQCLDWYLCRKKLESPGKH